MGVVQIEGGAIGVAEAGSGGVPLVLLHGVGSDKSVWAPQLAHFGQQRRTIALDYPGYGQSASRPAATREDFAAAMWDALDALGVGQAHLCGLSLGGVVAIAMHAARPQRCASLIIANSFAIHPEGTAIHDRSLLAARNLGMRGLAQARLEALLSPAAGADVRHQVVETMAAIDPAAYALGAASVWLADQRERASRIACPTLILCGSEDSITPPALSDQLKQLIPHATLVEIAGASHLSNLDQPAIFNRVLETFFAGVDEAGGDLPAL